MFKATITVKLRSSILDPEGKAIEQALQSLEFSQLSSVRVGKIMELSVDTADRSEAEKIVDDACRKLLANVVMEDYAFELQEL